MQLSWTRPLALFSLFLSACADAEQGEVDPGQATGACIEGQCFNGLACLSDLCVMLPGGGSSNPSGGTVGDPGGNVTDSPTSSPTSGPTTGSPTGDPTGDPTGSPTGDPTGDPTGSPTSDPGTTSGPGSDTNPDPSDPMTTMPGNCKQLQLDKLPANIMLVVDRSGSIAQAWDQGQSKWGSVHKTLTAALAKSQANLKLGLMLFPSSSATSDYSQAACVTNAVPEVALGLDNGAKVLAALPERFGPAAAGGSPTAKGLIAALAALNAAPASEGRAMVLISDGPFNCPFNALDNNALFETLDNNVHTIVDSAWKQDKISTLVVGVNISKVTSDGSKDAYPNNTNSFDQFQTLAVEGGQPRSGADKFYAAYTEAELAAFTLEAISKADTCTLALGLTPIDPTATVVMVAGTNYAYDLGLDCAVDSGWIYSDANNTRIQMCGAACTALKSAGSAEVAVCD